MELALYKIDADYLKFLHTIDSRVSVKFNNRPFVGVLTMINGVKYVLPLTSQTTEERKKRGKKKRAAVMTTFVREHNGREIANILHNNMIPVLDSVVSLIPIDTRINTYEANEIRYIRKNADEIIKKANMVYQKRVTNYNEFFLKACCDFKKLENEMNDFR